MKKEIEDKEAAEREQKKKREAQQLADEKAHRDKEKELKEKNEELTKQLEKLKAALDEATKKMEGQKEKQQNGDTIREEADKTERGLREQLKKEEEERRKMKEDYEKELAKRDEQEKKRREEEEQRKKKETEESKKREEEKKKEEEERAKGEAEERKKREEEKKRREEEEEMRKKRDRGEDTLKEEMDRLNRLLSDEKEENGRLRERIEELLKKLKEREEERDREKKERDEETKALREREEKRLAQMEAEKLKQEKERADREKEEKQRKDEKRKRKEAEEKERKEKEQQREAEEEKRRKESERQMREMQEKFQREAEGREKRENEEREKREAADKAQREKDRREIEERLKKQEEERKKEEEERRKKEKEEREKRDAEEKKRREEDEKYKREMADKLKQVEDQRSKETEEKKKKDEEEKLKKEEKAKKREEEEERNKREEQEKREGEEEKKRREEEEKRKKEEERKKREEEDKLRPQKEEALWEGIIQTALSKAMGGKATDSKREAMRGKMELKQFKPEAVHPHAKTIIEANIPADSEGGPSFLLWNLDGISQKFQRESETEDVEDSEDVEGQGDSSPTSPTITMESGLKPPTSRIPTPSPKKTTQEKTNGTPEKSTPEKKTTKTASSSKLSVTPTKKAGVSAKGVSPKANAAPSATKLKADLKTEKKEESEKAKETMQKGPITRSKEGVSDGALQISRLVENASMEEANKQAAVLGGPGSGKTRAVLESLCLQYGLYFSVNQGSGDLSWALGEETEEVKKNGKSADTKSNHRIRALLLARLLVQEDFVGGEEKITPYHWMLAQTLPHQILGSDVFLELTKSISEAPERIVRLQLTKALSRVARDTVVPVHVDDCQQIDSRSISRLISEWSPHNSLLLLFSTSSPSHMDVIKETSSSDPEVIVDLSSFQDDEQVTQFLSALFPLKDKALQERMGHLFKGTYHHSHRYASTVLTASGDQLQENREDLLSNLFDDYTNRYLPSPPENPFAPERTEEVEEQVKDERLSALLDDAEMFERAAILTQNWFSFGHSSSEEDPSFFSLLPLGYFSMSSSPSGQPSIRVSDHLSAHALATFLTDNDCPIDVSVGDTPLAMPDPGEEGCGIFNEEVLLRGIRDYFQGPLDEHPYFTQHYGNHLPSWVSGLLVDLGSPSSSSPEAEPTPVKIVRSSTEKTFARYTEEKGEPEVAFVPEESSNTNAFFTLKASNSRSRAALVRWSYSSSALNRREAGRLLWSSGVKGLYVNREKTVHSRLWTTRRRVLTNLNEKFSAGSGIIRFIFTSPDCPSLHPYVSKNGDVVVVLNEKLTQKMFEAHTWKWLRTTRIARSKVEIEAQGRRRRFKSDKKPAPVKPTFKAVKGDAVDELFSEYINSSWQNGNAPRTINRVGNGKYIIDGCTTIHVKNVNGRLVVRVGGGWQSLDEFLQKHNMNVSDDGGNGNISSSLTSVTLKKRSTSSVQK